jgi:hypothetical protein
MNSNRRRFGTQGDVLSVFPNCARAAATDEKGKAVENAHDARRLHGLCARRVLVQHTATTAGRPLPPGERPSWWERCNCPCHGGV